MTLPSSSGKKVPAWLEKIYTYYDIQDVLQMYVGLSIWVIQWDGHETLEWMELTPQTQMVLRPAHFEKAYGKETERVAYHLRSLKRAAQDKKVLVDQCGGVFNFFIPIGQVEKHQYFFYADFFLKSPPDWNSLSEKWRQLTGKEPVETDMDFVSYVKMILRFPVLEEPLLKGVKDFFECYVDFLTGKTSPVPIYERVNQLRKKVFSTKLPNITWLQDAQGYEKLIPLPWLWSRNDEVAPWMVEEIGISRSPDRVLAMMPIHPKGLRGKPVQIMLHNYEIQQACLSFAREMPQTVAEKLQDYGVVFLTSPDAAENEIQAKLQMRETAEQIQKFIRQRFGLHSVVGIGHPVLKGESLYPSFQESVLSLNLCVQTNKSILFYEENPLRGSDLAYVWVHKTARELLKAFEEASADRIKLAGNHYVQAVLEFSADQVGVVRSQFLSVFFQLFDEIRKKSVLDEENAASYSENFCRKLQEADSIYRLIGFFKEALEKLSRLMTQPLEGAKSVRFETVIRFIQNNFQQPLGLRKVAKDAGFSVPVFCRLFKKETGINFLAFLNQLRVEKAKELLNNNDLPISNIGHSCGFLTISHFNRVFKKGTGFTPTAYRDKFLKSRLVE